MNILGIDVSGKSTGVCVYTGEGEIYSETLSLGLTHSEILLPLVQQVLQKAGCLPQEIGCYAVTIGPGSFTGLRIGLALVKGMAFSKNVPVAPVSTLHAMAQGSGLCGRVICALDARREQVYWAAFDCDGTTAVRLTSDSANSVQELVEMNLFSKTPTFVLGDGAKMCYTSLGNLETLLIPPKEASMKMAQGAVSLAREMLLAGKLVPAEEVEPVYLRLSQAEREWAEKMSRIEKNSLEK